MLRFIPFLPEHLLSMEDADSRLMHAAGSAEELMKHPSFSAVTLEGRVIACGGMHPIWLPTRWNCWAYMNDECGPHMLQILRFVRFVLGAYPVPRVEAHVREGFPQGFKFARAMGFVLETPQPMRQWAPDGSSVYQFGLVR